MRLARSMCFVVVVAACGKTHRGEPKAPELEAPTAEVARGERLFRKFCYQCHPGGAGGLGPAINHLPLPELAIRTQIREGVGSMPAFDESWLSDDEVAAIAEYVQTLRAAPTQRQQRPRREGTMTTRR